MSYDSPESSNVFLTSVSSSIKSGSALGTGQELTSRSPDVDPTLGTTGQDDAINQVKHTALSWHLAILFFICHCKNKNVRHFDQLVNRAYSCW